MKDNPLVVHFALGEKEMAQRKFRVFVQELIGRVPCDFSVAYRKRELV